MTSTLPRQVFFAVASCLPVSSTALSPSPVVVSVRSLLGLAWPIIVSRSTQVVVGLTDALMVVALGEEALAATTAGGFNAFAVFILPMGVVFIVSSFSAQLHGQKDPLGARRFGHYGLVAAGLTQLLAVAGTALVGPVLGLFPYAAPVRELMTEYLVIRLWAGGAVIGLEALANYYGGLGRTRIPMFASTLAMVLNVFGNWVLIRGNLGAPALGVAGAAWASALSTWGAFLALAAYFFFEGRGLARPALSLREFGRMLRFGLPSGLNWFFEFFAFNFFINVVVAGLGTTALAAMMAVFQINSVSFMPAFGLASAGAILVGQSIGAGRKDEVPRALRLTFLVAGTWQGLVGLFYLFLPELLLGPFVKPDTGTDFLAVGARMLMLSAAWQAFDAAANTLAEGLRAAGDTAFPMAARLLIAWFFFVPGSYVTVSMLGGRDVVAVGWVVGYLFLLAAVLWWRFRTGAWRRIELVGPH